MPLRAPRLLAVLLTVLALALAACGDDDDGGGDAQPVMSGTSTAPSPKTRPVRTRCGDIVFKQDSGNAAFNLVVEGITCNDAEALLRSDDDLDSWKCEPIPGGSKQGGDRLRCAERDRLIEYTEGN